MKIESLNIQGGFKIDEIASEIKEKLSPFDLLALQEVKEVGNINHTSLLLEGLGGNYSAIDWFPTTFGSEKFGKMGNAIIYSDQLKLISKKLIKIPDYDPNWKWKILRKRFRPVQRLAISALFEINNKKVRVTNVHLEYSGDSNIRQEQLNYLLKKVPTGSDLHILLGDFNTLGKLDKKLPELELLIKYGFKLASKNIRWTANPDSPDPNWFATPYIQTIRKLGFDLRQNLDHVLLKGDYKKAKCKTIKINSSDHNAIVCEIDL